MDVFELSFKEIKDEVRASMLATRNWITENSAYMGQFIHDSLKQMHQYAQTGFAMAFTWIHSLPEKISAWISLGFYYGKMGATFFLKSLQKIPEYVKSFMLFSWQMLVKGFHLGVNLWKFFKENLGVFFNHLAKITTEILKLIQLVFKFLWHHLKKVVLNLPHLIKHLFIHVKQILADTWEFIQLVLTQLKALMYDCSKLVWDLMKALYNRSYEIAAHIITEVTKVLANVCKSLLKHALIGIGIVYGVSSVLVDTMGELLQTIMLKSLGITLPTLAAITMLKTGLSVALAASAIFFVARFSYMALAGMYGLTFLSKSKTPKSTMTTTPVSKPEHDAHPYLTAHPKPILSSYRNVKALENTEDLEKNQSNENSISADMGSANESRFMPTRKSDRQTFK